MSIIKFPGRDGVPPDQPEENTGTISPQESADDILNKMLGQLSSCIVIGETKDGGSWLYGVSHADIGRVFYAIECFKRDILED